MPRPTRAQGRPGTRVIPAGWEAGHRPVVEKTLRAQVRLRPPGTTQEWSDEKQQMVAVPLPPYYADRARIQVLGQQARTVVTADDVEVVANYLVVVPSDAGPVAVDHLVVVVESGDELLDGRVLLVREVVHGSERFERDLFCSLTT